MALYLQLGKNNKINVEKSPSSFEYSPRRSRGRIFPLVVVTVAFAFSGVEPARGKTNTTNPTTESKQLPQVVPVPGFSTIDPGQKPAQPGGTGSTTTITAGRAHSPRAHPVMPPTTLRPSPMPPTTLGPSPEPVHGGGNGDAFGSTTTTAKPEQPPPTAPSPPSPATRATINVTHEPAEGCATTFSAEGAVWDLVDGYDLWFVLVSYPNEANDWREKHYFPKERIRGVYPGPYNTYKTTDVEANDDPGTRQYSYMIVLADKDESARLQASLDADVRKDHTFDSERITRPGRPLEQTPDFTQSCP
jgi:hypothetical protein